MLKINDYVHHKHSGVCIVQDIAPLIPDSPLLYYQMKPLYGEDKGTVLRIPVTNVSSLSPLLTKKEANEIIAAWPRGKDLYEVDSKKRKAEYEQAIVTGNYRSYPKLLEGIRQKKAKEGHLNSMDQQFYVRALPLLYGELAQALGLNYEDVDDYILSKASS